MCYDRVRGVWSAKGRNVWVQTASSAPLPDSPLAPNRAGDTGHARLTSLRVHCEMLAPASIRDYARTMSAIRSRAAVPTGAERTLELLERQVGRSLSDVETPVAVIDIDRLDTNLRDLQSYVDLHHIELWPHTKTHKSPEIGRRQLELGAGGLTVAKTGEAQVFQEAGAPRILVHYPPFGTDKWERLADIAASGVELTVAVDSVAPAEGLARALDRRGLRAQLLVEVDVGLHRTGLTTPAGALAVAQELSKLPAVEVAGISCYPGHCRGDAETIRSRLEAVDALLRETRDLFIGAGVRCDRISGGSTPTRYLTHETCVNELRAGTYALLDRVDGPGEPDGGLDACALWVEVTVVSDAVPEQQRSRKESLPVPLGESSASQ